MSRHINVPNYIPKSVITKAIRDWNKKHDPLNANGTKKQLMHRLVSAAGKQRTAWYVARASAGILTVAIVLVALRYYKRKHNAPPRLPPKPLPPRKGKAKKRLSPSKDDAFWDADEQEEGFVADGQQVVEFEPTPPRPKLFRKPTKKKIELLREMKSTTCTLYQNLANSAGLPKRIVNDPRYQKFKGIQNDLCTYVRKTSSIHDVLAVLWGYHRSYFEKFLQYMELVRDSMKRKKILRQDFDRLFQPFQRVPKVELQLNEVLKLKNISPLTYRLATDLKKEFMDFQNSPAIRKIQKEILLLQKI